MIQRALQRIRETAAAAATTSASSSESDPSEKNPRKKRVRREEQIQCRFCNQWLKFYCITRHLRQFHGAEGDEEAYQLLAAKLQPTRCYTENCAYHGQNGLVREMEASQSQRQSANRVKTMRHTIQCPVCSELVGTQELLTNHCREAHGDEECIVEERQFTNEAEFEDWKEATQKAHCTSWQTATTSQMESHYVKYYRCSRAGVYRNRGRGKKMCSSKVATRYCTSFLKKVVASSGKVSVRFCTKHNGHDVSVADLPLSKADRQYQDPNNKLHWLQTNSVRNVAASLALQERKQRAMESGSSPTSSTADEPLFSGEDYKDSAISATELLKESEMCLESEPDDDLASSVHSGTDEYCTETAETPVPAESLLSCSSCLELSERAVELECIVERLKKRLADLERSLEADVVKEER